MFLAWSHLNLKKSGIWTHIASEVNKYPLEYIDSHVYSSRGQSALLS